MRKLLFFSILALAMAACTDEKEPIPAYVKVNPFVVNADGGATWQKVSDGWFRINKTVQGEFLGAYTLPASVPVLSEGETEIVILPGVKENGIVSTPGLYPFLLPFKTKVNLKPGEETTVTPTTAYDPTTKFIWSLSKSSFDGGTITLENLDSDAKLNFAYSNDGFDGRCVLMQVDTGHLVMEIATDKVLLPARADRPTWIELHHRNDIPFTLSIWGYEKDGTQSGRFTVFGFNPSKNDAWNKIYLNITDLTANNPKDTYRVVVTAALPLDFQTGKYQQIKGNVRLDNLRILHF